MKKLIRQLTRDKKICSIYRFDTAPERFTVGYILKSDEDSILIQSLSPYGENDGFIYRLIEDIATIEVDTDYLEDIKILSENNKVAVKDLNISNNNIFSDLINYVMTNKLICTFELSHNIDRCICGIINEIDESLLRVEIINEHGQESGYAYVDIDEISSIIVQSQDERKLQILYSKKINR